MPTLSFALDLFVLPRVDIGFLSGFLFSLAFLYFFSCFWGSLCPYLGLPAFGILQPSTWGKSSTCPHHVIFPSRPSLAVFQPDRARAFSSWSFCFLFYFFIWFPCILFLLGFPVFALVFLCIAPLCLFCVFFGFYSSANLLRTYFAVLRPLPSLFPCPHRVELPTHPSMYGAFLHVISFIFLYFIVFLLIINPVSIGLLLGVTLGPNLWVVDVNSILAFGSRRTSVGLWFSTLNVKKQLLSMH